MSLHWRTGTIATRIKELRKQLYEARDDVAYLKPGDVGHDRALAKIEVIERELARLGEEP
jgi:hypothetical protein